MSEFSLEGEPEWLKNMTNSDLLEGIKQIMND